jgi:hypothetical protein
MKFETIRDPYPASVEAIAVPIAILCYATAVALSASGARVPPRSGLQPSP